MSEPLATNRQILMQVIQQKLIPNILSHGFTALDFPQSNRSHEVDFAFPFGYFRRVQNSDFELLEIQLDKNGSPQFVINFGTVPPEGTRLLGQHYSQSNALVSALPERYRLFSSRGFMRWFGPSSITAPIFPNTRIERAVTRAISLYPEIEAAFRNKALGPHIRKTSFSREAPKPSTSINLSISNFHFLRRISIVILALPAAGAAVTALIGFLKGHSLERTISDSSSAAFYLLLVGTVLVALFAINSMGKRRDDT